MPRTRRRLPGRSAPVGYAAGLAVLLAGLVAPQLGMRRLAADNRQPSQSPPSGVNPRTSPKPA